MTPFVDTRIHFYIWTLTKTSVYGTENDCFANLSMQIHRGIWIFNTKKCTNIHFSWSKILLKCNNYVWSPKMQTRTNLCKYLSRGKVKITSCIILTLLDQYSGKLEERSLCPSSVKWKEKVGPVRVNWYFCFTNKLFLFKEVILGWNVKLKNIKMSQN